MALEAVYKTKEDFEGAVEEAFRSLYSERNGQYELTGLTGIKTQADVDRLTESLRKERTDHGQTKAKLQAWEGLGVKVEDVQTKLDKYDELETAATAAGKLNEEQINQIVESRLKTRIAPIERERDALKTQLTEATDQINGFQSRERQRKIHDAIRSAATDAKILPTALDDALMLAERVFDVEDDGAVKVKDQVGYTPGVTPDIWLTEIQTKRPHWWPESVGGGAKGSRATGNGLTKNPWTEKHWNLTEQGQYIKTNGPEKARQMAELAGSHIGATHPPASK